MKICIINNAYFVRCALMLSILLSGCGFGKSGQDEMSNNIHGYAFLKERPNPSQVYAKLGLPDYDWKFGGYSPVYKLENNAELHLNYSGDFLASAAIGYTDGSWFYIVSPTDREVKLSIEIQDYAFLKERPSYEQVNAELGYPDGGGIRGFADFYELKENAKLYLAYRNHESLDSAVIIYSDGSRQILVSSPGNEMSNDINDYSFLKERPGYNQIIDVLGPPFYEGGTVSKLVSYRLENDSVLYLWFDKNKNNTSNLWDPDHLFFAEIEYSDGSRQIIVPPAESEN